MRIKSKAQLRSGPRRAASIHLLRAAFGALLLAFSGANARAAAGDLDSTFGRTGQIATDFGRSNDLGYAVAQQSDGKLVVAGIRFVGNSATGGDFVVARYKMNGQLDRSFGTNGSVITDFGLTETPAAVVIQPDGKIIVAGGTYPIFPSQGGQFALARYNPDG